MTGIPTRDGEARRVFGGVELRAADGVILATLALFSLLAVGFRGAVEGWSLLLAKNAGVALAVLASAAVMPRVRRPVVAFFLRTATVSLSYAYLFGAVASLQLVLHGRFQDDLVLAFEAWLFGVQPTLWLERFVTPPLTEWMMFCYVIYVPLYPVLCAVLWVRRGRAAAEEYFLALGLANVLCDAGFILFPVASPMYWMADRFSIPLDGGLFTWVGELIRTHAHYAGGSLPSPHAAAATVMWVMAWKHHRPTFWLLSPVVLSLYVSTFYGRFHYVTDAVFGIATAGLAVVLTPLVQRAWDRLSGAGPDTSAECRT
ncbi:MAG: phosphatase PAP2 family protein [Holophagales bacterium]|nr:phosphatase PAP2 family protein [Holophagales bacterium]